MRKFFIFAIALVASVMAFTSCDKKDKENVNPLIGTWTATVDRGWSIIEYTLIFEETNYSLSDKNNVDTKIDVGTYDVNLEKQTGVMHQKTVTFISDVQNGTFPNEEDHPFTYSINDKTLNITIDPDEDHPMKLTLTKDSQNDPGKTEDDDEPSDINIDPAKLVNTEWRTDSCFMNGQKTQPPHLYIEILSEDAALINGENHNFAFTGNKLSCTYFEDMLFTIVEVQEGWAHVKGDNGSDIYLSQLPAKDIEAQIMDQQVSDFVGTWKFAYYAYSNNNSGYETRTAGTNPGVETWEFKADGTCIYNSWFSGETVTGTWEHSYFEIKFTKNPAIGVITEDEMITVQPLTPNWMCLYRSTNNGTQNFQWWFYRVK